MYFFLLFLVPLVSYLVIATMVLKIQLYVFLQKFYSFTFSMKSFIYFELIFIWLRRNCQLHSFACINPVVPASLQQRLFLPPLNCFGTIVKNYLTIKCEFMYSQLFSINLCLALCQYHITIALMSVSVIPPIWFFLRTALFIQDALQLDHLSIYVKKAVRNLVAISLNLQMILVIIVITILNFSIHILCCLFLICFCCGQSRYFV